MDIFNKMAGMVPFIQKMIADVSLAIVDMYFPEEY